ncbi:MAG TPA: hypothetical protein VF579_05140 [Candidatus Methylomirabilis sp.]
MLYWIGMTVAGLCATFSFYMAWVMLEAGDTRGGPWLFGAFGSFFAIPICIAIIKAAAKRIPLFGRIDRALDRGLVGTEKPRPPFVPHWQMMTMIVIAIIGILAAILLPIFIR